MLDMAEDGIACAGHGTSGPVEGENGNIVQQRAEHPYEMFDGLFRYVAERYAANKKEIDAFAAAGKKLTPFASDKFRAEMQLSRINKGYKISPNGDGYLVWDAQSSQQERHHVIIDETCPSCSPCNTWQQVCGPTLPPPPTLPSTTDLCASHHHHHHHRPHPTHTCMASRSFVSRAATCSS